MSLDIKIIKINVKKLKQLQLNLILEVFKIEA